MNTLGTLVMKFFRNYLANELAASPNTVASYSDCVRLLLSHASETLKVTPDQLSLDALDERTILSFLDHLEAGRGNAAATRNQRLGAIKTFFRFLARNEPTMLAACERVGAISAKSVPHKAMDTLDNREVKAVFAGTGGGGVHDARDRALLLFLYNTGARAQELVDLDVGGVRMDTPCLVKLTGKGRKERFVPLHQETVDALRQYLVLRAEAGMRGEAAFLNDRGERLTRFGVAHIVKWRVQGAAGLEPSLVGRRITPHTFRHTTALHLVQSGVDISVVKEWLGHADVKTTSMYLEIDLETKRKALEAFPPPVQPGGTAREQPKWRQPDVMKFLRSLSLRSALC